MWMFLHNGYHSWRICEEASVVAGLNVPHESLCADYESFSYDRSFDSLNPLATFLSYQGVLVSRDRVAAYKPTVRMTATSPIDG